MIKSMTGYGRYELVDGNHKLTVEVKSVNHRYLDLSVKMPRIFNCFESSIRSLVKEDISRGKVDMYISYEHEAAHLLTLKYNEELAGQYTEYMRSMAEHFGLADDLTVTALARMPEVLTMEQENEDAQELWPLIETAIKEADRAFIEARETEGVRLREDLLVKLDYMEELVAQVCARAPQLVQEYKSRLLEKLQEVLADTSLDENRIAAEVTIYADKVCVDEEMVRLRTHIRHMREELDKGDSVGRKLDFLAQEMNREANTTLSKVNDVSMADIAIDLKTEIEKLREQIQNIE